MAFSPYVVLTPERKAVEGGSRKIKVEQKDADRCQFLRIDKLIQFSTSAHKKLQAARVAA
jgi:hypothetical protein